MQFAAPAAYAGLFALAAIPAVIYLIFRRKRRDVAWGAMYVLRRTLEAQSLGHPAKALRYYRDALGVRAAVAVYPGDASTFYDRTSERSGSVTLQDLRSVNQVV